MVDRRRRGSGARRRPGRTLAAFAVAAAFFGLGGYSAQRDLWPWPWLRLAKAELFGEADQPPRYTIGAFGRLTDKADSEAVECPVQDARTAVFLIAGQSN